MIHKIFHILASNGSLVTAIQTMAKYEYMYFMRPPFCYFTFYKNSYLNKHYKLFEDLLPYIVSKYCGVPPKSLII
jgi:hypothetical protein